MLEILDGFNKRMEFIAIVDSITNRKNTSDKIEGMFKPNEMENLILSTLIYIMESNLAEEEAVTIENIAKFLRNVLDNDNLNEVIIDFKELARYIVKDILQNKGQNRYFRIMNYSDNTFNSFNIRLVTDKIDEENKVIYELTEQGYDFLFRTKEVDDELGFKLEELKLKMLIQKKNYKKAINSSRELIRLLKNKKIILNQFEASFKTNINDISGIRYENLIDEIYTTIEDGYNEMLDLQDMIEKSRNQIKAEEDLVEELDEKTKKAKREAWRISENISYALTMQIELLSRCKDMKKIYLNVLHDAMEYSIVKTYNFEENILNKLEKINNSEILDVYTKLLRPLFLPRVPKYLNLNLCYDTQTKLSNNEIDEYNLGLDIETIALEREKKIERRNNAHIQIMKEFLKYGSQSKKEFLFSDFINTLEENTYFKDMIEDKLLFMAFLKLYEYQTIDVKNWLNEDTVSVSECNGEFDVEYCLKQIMYESNNLYGIKKITIEKTDKLYELNYEDSFIEASDMRFIFE